MKFHYKKSGENNFIMILKYVDIDMHDSEEN